MAIGSRIGSRTSFLGSAIGSAADDEGSGAAAPAYSVDSGSLKAVPSSAAEWSAFIAAKALTTAVPDSLWLCQEPSGTLADTTGSVPLVPSGSVTYLNTVPGWTRVGVGVTEAAAVHFMAAAGVGPNPTTTSSLWLYYVAVAPTMAGNRMMMSAGGALATTDKSMFVTGATGIPFDRTVNVSVSGTVDTRNTVQPLVLLYDRTGGRSMAYTLSQKIIGTYSALVTDGAKGIGASFSLASNSQYLYGAMLSGTNAEITDAQVKSLLTALGWAIPWT